MSTTSTVVPTSRISSVVDAMVIPSSSSSSSSSPSGSTSSFSTNAFYTQLPLYVQRLSEHAILPSRGSEYAAGLDLSSAEDTIIKGNGGRALVKTDLRIACPPGTYIRIAPRSGLAYKYGIDVGAGVIDADYRGPIGVILFNFGTSDFTIQRGDRIAQAILEQIYVPSEIINVPMNEELPNIGTRGENGFGSTGIGATTGTKPQIAMTVIENDVRKKPRSDVEETTTTTTTTTISPSISEDGNENDPNTMNEDK